MINLLEQVEKEVLAGNVFKQKHPTLPLCLYKYTAQCVYNKNWNDITLQCRGLVLDNNGSIVINSIPKFFNHYEVEEKYKQYKNSNISYTITEKLDGSLIQVSRWNNELIITSSGSFVSEQALKARQLLDELNLKLYFRNNYTYIFELIYPENRIVLNYGNKTSIVLLAIRETRSGKEIKRELFDDWFEIVNEVTFNIEQAEADLSKKEFINKEGYVVRFDDGTRFKLKYDEYMSLHKLITGINEKYIWESLKDGVNIKDNISNIPDELYNFIKNTKYELEQKFYKIKHESLISFLELNNLNLSNRKDKANWIIKNKNHLSSILFCMLDNKSYDNKIWKMIEPTINTIYRNNEE